MTFISSANGRVPNVLQEMISSENVRARTLAATRSSIELASGKKVLTPGDNPNAAFQATIFSSLQAANDTFRRSIESGSNTLAQTESVLAGFVDVADATTSIVLRNTQQITDFGESSADLSEVRSSVDALLVQSNESYLNRFLFAGQRSDEAPFRVVGEGIVFSGDNELTESLRDIETTFASNVTANSSIGTDSAAGRGVALDVTVDPGTRLSELNGGDGVRLGRVSIDNGTTADPVIVDLSEAATLNDVINAINNALPGTPAQINATDSGLEIGGVGAVVVQEVDGGRTASDLGILTSAAGSAIPLDGDNLRPIITLNTSLSRLDPNIRTGPVNIAQGNSTVSVDTQTLTPTDTVADLLNLFNAADVYVRAEINDAQNGINVVNVYSGVPYVVTDTQTAVGPPPTFTSAAQTLGILTTDERTALADFNDNGGIDTVPGNDLQFTLRDGTTFEVNLSRDLGQPGGDSLVSPSVATVADVQTRIYESARAAGLNVPLPLTPGGSPPPGPYDLVVEPNPVGGIRLTDGTGGGGNFVVESVNGSLAGEQLGILGDVAADDILGENRHEGRVKGIFDTLLRLESALQNGDAYAVERTGKTLAEDQQRLVAARGETGSRLVVLESSSRRLQEQSLDLEQFTANAVEIDLSETITRLLSEQTALEATLASTGRLLQGSLLDFI
ncbi:flagellar hook-associated protein FlgL [Planctomycetes bacterium Pan216]|uniref:Flagellar hook-associated protein FlgL n=1 Tax=Kolteria novifilia TaxID=2527975 RepID=A0A518AXV8_9BACT|nr:flagellar hook-associated protein FlgL [Planctomycetes bacterium Pan216]